MSNTKYIELQEFYKIYSTEKKNGKSDKEIAKITHHSVTTVRNLLHQYEVFSAAPSIQISIISDVTAEGKFELEVKRFSKGKWFRIKKEELDANPYLLERIRYAVEPFNNEEIDQLSKHIDQFA